MIDLNKLLQTRDGRQVEIHSRTGRGEFPIIGYIGDSTAIVTWTETGTFNVGGVGHPSDLVNVPVKRTGYINVYAGHTSSIHISREEADKRAASKRTGCVRIEFGEGQFDD